MKQYDVSLDNTPGRVMMFDILDKNDQVSIFVKPEELSLVEVEANNMWITFSHSGTRYLTINKPNDYIREGWIKEK